MISMILYGFGMAGVLVIVWIGWLRTRRAGYLVLAVWAIAAMAGMAASYLPLLQVVMGKTLNSDNTVRMMMWLNLFRTIVSSALLLTGLALLVFGPKRDLEQRPA